MTPRRLVKTCGLFLIVVAACGGRGDPLVLKELDRARAGEFDVVLLASQPALRAGHDSFGLEFRRGETLVDVGTVRVNATMAMAGMAPMFGKTEVTPASVKGRFTVISDLSMAGAWRLSVEWEGPAGKGSAAFAETVQ